MNPQRSAALGQNLKTRPEAGGYLYLRPAPSPKSDDTVCFELPSQVSNKVL